MQGGQEAPERVNGDSSGLEDTVSRSGRRLIPNHQRSFL